MGGNTNNQIFKINADAPGGSAALASNISHISLSALPDNNSPIPSVCKIVKTGHSVISGKSNGLVDVIDPNSNQVVKTFRAHGGVISDMDAKETTILTCGYSMRKTGLVLDPLVNIFDLRAGKSLPPLAFPAGAAFVKLHPKLSTCAFVASHTGQIQILDFANPTSSQVRLHQASLGSTGILSDFAVSPSGGFLALADGPEIQLWNNRSDDSGSFNEFAAPIDFPVDPAASITQPAYIDIDDESVPLSSVGMPYYKDELLSSWSQQPGMPMVFEEGMPQQRMPFDVLTQIKAAATSKHSSISHTDLEHGGIGLTGRLPQPLKRAAQKYISYKDIKRDAHAAGPKFISERSVDTSNTVLKKLTSGDTQIPQDYRKLHIKYSKFGITDFDFAYYNHTKYSGLEPQLINSYCNPLLQLFMYTPDVFEFALNSLRHNALDDKSLLAEFGLLFDMLLKAEGQHCAATNFVKTLAVIPQANALGLVVDDTNPLHTIKNMAFNHMAASESPSTGIEFCGNSVVATIFGRQFNIPISFLSSKVTSEKSSTDPFSSVYHAQGFILQEFCRFLMERLAIDARAYSPDSQAFELIAGIKTKTYSSFVSCGKESSRHNTVYSLEMAPLSEIQRQDINNKKQEFERQIFTSKSKMRRTEKKEDAEIFDDLFENETDSLDSSNNTDNTSCDSFLTILQNTLEKKTASRSYCEDCKKFQLCICTKIVEELPSVFTLHVPLSFDNAHEPRSKDTADNQANNQQNIPTFSKTREDQPIINNNPINKNPPTMPIHNFVPGSQMLVDNNNGISANSSHSGLFVPPSPMNPVMANPMNPSNSQQPPGFFPAMLHEMYTPSHFPNQVVNPHQNFSNMQPNPHHDSLPYMPRPPVQQQPNEQSRFMPQLQPQKPQNTHTPSNPELKSTGPFWRQKNWPATQFAVRPADPLNPQNGLKVIPAREHVHGKSDLYKLVGVVVEINNVPDSNTADAATAGLESIAESHLISFVRISQDYKKYRKSLSTFNQIIGNQNISEKNNDYNDFSSDSDSETDENSENESDSWHLFNDFLVKPVGVEEVLDFSPAWKTPVVFTFQKVSDSDRQPFDFEKWRKSLDTSILYRDHFAAGTREGFRREYELLDPEHEVPSPGTLVAIDTEFVQLSHEETEIFSDGTKSLIRPKEMALARVSVVRGQGPKQGSPFIDDFIAMANENEKVMDYLTEFSGIEPGDLDPYSSKRGGLVTRETSYKRLWLLLNLGCIFVGHGLHNDFRTVNIHVPSTQVIDTSRLYYLPEYRRYLSLKFLAYTLLNEDVQAGNHDSIEDAVTALRLYQTYKRLITNNGKSGFQVVLHQIYQEGKKCNFKPPKFENEGGSAITF